MPHGDGGASPEFVSLQQVVAGRYSLQAELGRGGMGIVFLARDVALERLVAIKMLPPAMAEDLALRSRFLREARTAAGLSHPHIVSIHAVEEHGAVVFFVMSYIEGETLRERVRRRGPLSPAGVMRLVQETAWALSHAHARGIVHCDIKPDNIMLERHTGRAVVTDFGIARVASGTDDRGSAIGTPQYMAPEQASGDTVDGRADLYALGATAWYALTGRPPFESDSASALMLRHATEPAPPVGEHAAGVPARFAAAVDRLLLKRPEDRYPSAEALAEAVTATRDSVPETPPPVRSFLRDAVAAGGEIGVPLMVGVGSLVIYATIFRTSPFAGLVFYPLSAMGVGLAGARFGQLMGKTRDLIRQGYDFRSIEPAVARESRAMQEETRVQPKARRDIIRETAAISLIGAAKTAVLVWLATINGPVWVNYLAAAGAVMVPAVAVRRIWTVLHLGKPSRWLKAIGGKVGRLMFRAAGLGLQAPPLLAGDAGQPTELALGGAILRLFDALSSELRQQFADVPDVVQSLERDASALRLAGPEGGQRLVGVVAALETLRLDLMRLTVAGASAVELTEHLSLARRVGQAVDLRLLAEDEVRRALREGRAPDIMTPFEVPHRGHTPGRVPSAAAPPATPETPTPTPLPS